MKYLHHLITSYPVSCFYIVFIWLLCFAHVPQTPLDDVSFIDKWAHIAMYAGTWFLPIVMSGVIEILQATCTGGQRSGDWLDFAANAVGATLGTAIGIVLAAYRAKQKKD